MAVWSLSEGKAHTVRGCLEALPADLALEVPKARLLFNFDVDGLFVIAEEAVEDRGKRIVLETIATGG